MAYLDVACILQTFTFVIRFLVEFPSDEHSRLSLFVQAPKPGIYAVFLHENMICFPRDHPRNSGLCHSVLHPEAAEHQVLVYQRSVDY